jgi:hypothetical protein
MGLSIADFALTDVTKMMNITDYCGKSTNYNYGCELGQPTLGSFDADDDFDYSDTCACKERGYDQACIVCSW